MRRVRNQLPEKKKLNNSGSAMILALTVLSLIAILGIMALSSALLNVRMRDLNRKSDKNFYYLETALDEIYAQTGRMASDILKENYLGVMEKLYKDGYRTNDEANAWLRAGFMKELTGKNALGLSLPLTDENNEENLKNAAEKLASFSDTIQKQNLEVFIDSIIMEKQVMPEGEELAMTGSGNAAPLSVPGPRDSYSGITLKGFCLIYTNPDTGIESAVTVDLRIRAPYVRFMNEGDALLDYVLAANGDIKVNQNGTSRTVNEFTGNIYGNSITVFHSELDAAGRLIAAKGNITADNRAELTIFPAVNTGAKSRVWADGIELNASSTLTAEDADIFVKDDLTLKGDKNNVTLKGSYYGYGNEGDSSALEQETPNKSSAVIINDRGSSLDLTGLDSLILAGRAYMRFDDTITNGQYVYPMGESLAVKATQTMYLIPETSIRLAWNGNTQAAGSNPVLLPDEADGYTLALQVELPDEMGGKKAEYQIRIDNPRAESDSEKEITVTGPGTQDSPVVPVILNGKVYIYYNFDSESERRDYFVNYLDKNASSFDDLLEKSRMGKSGGTAGGDGSGIYIKGSGSQQIHTSGALYQVAGDKGEDEHLFQLLKKGEDGVGSKLEWVNLIGNLNASFKNIQDNLAETDRVGGRAGEAAMGISSILPIGNYVKIDEVKKLIGEPVYIKENGCCVLLSGDSVHVELGAGGDSASVTTLGRTFSMDGGLVVSAKDIEIGGEGAFNGLFMAAGQISVTGSARLTADGQTYEPILDREETAKYFYDYSDPASTVLNDYEDFVTRENWSRSGRERGGGK